MKKEFVAIAVKPSSIIKRFTIWIASGGALITLGFIMDGSTEVGHHAFLILGGVALGAGAMREWMICNQKLFCLRAIIDEAFGRSTKENHNA